MSGPNMFTGIIECIGTISHTRETAGGRRLSIRAAPLAAEAKLGDSIAVSGVCLTVTAITGDALEFDVIRETLDKTTLDQKRTAGRVNLERSLRVGDRLDGHFVQGHVDGVAEVERVLATPREHVLWLCPQPHLTPYIVPKGSVAIDGVSLTIAEVSGPSFSVALIPTTLQRTTLSDLQPGHRVNLESDILARTIVHCFQHREGQIDDADQGRKRPRADSAPALTLDSLKKAGLA